MLEQWRRRRAARRVKPGDGRPLKRFRWWQALTGRSVLAIQLTDDDGRPVTYTVDVRPMGDGDTGEVVARLYRDGRHHAESKVPAVLPVDGGVIEVATSTYGVRRCHYVAEDGTERQLTPDPRSAEGRRARLTEAYPAVSRLLGAVSVVLLVVGLGLNLVQVLDPLSRIPPIAENIGVFVSPVQLPWWLNVALGVGAALAGWERALRLRYHWLLDEGGT